MTRSPQYRCLPARLRAGALVPLAFSIAYALAGCSGAKIEGSVRDTRGETLPGVAVEVEGQGYQALTNVYGKYAVEYDPGALVLRFMKTGYTPGRIELAVNERRNVAAADVSLWPLPQAAGVFLLENFRYRETKPIEPDSWNAADTSVIFGTTRWTDVETQSEQPVVLCYRMPKEGIRFCRLDLREVLPQGSDPGAQTIEVWAPAETIPVTPQPVDAPEGLLTTLGLAGPLPPGSYAVHWGALEGDRSRERRMFLFNVGDRPMPVTIDAAPPAPAEKPPATEQAPAPSETPAEPPADADAPSEG